MSFTLESIGFSKEELQEKVIDRIAEQVMRGVAIDEDGNEFIETSAFATKLRKGIQERVDAQIAAIADKHVLPKVSELIESIALQQTNSWGEKVGKSRTFIEYLTDRAAAYLQEQVDHAGKGKGESDSYSWTGRQTRITHLVHHHLQYTIETAMKNAVSDVNKAITKGIAETVKIKLDEVAKQFKVSVTV